MPKQVIHDLFSGIIENCSELWPGIVLEFYPIITEDGTISLYNFTINDVYHSKVGAYTEALHKYTIPSGILEFVKHNNEVKILDICFGLGYNSKVAVSEIRKINPDCKIHVNALEIDEKVLALSCFVSPTPSEIENSISNVFSDAISKVININAILENYLDEISLHKPHIETILPPQYKSIDIDEIKTFLHNIYYRTISTRYSRDCSQIPPDALEVLDNSLTASILIGDARKTVEAIHAQHDYIFLDAFTPSKTPALWSVDFFKKLYKLLNDKGNLTTYTSAAPVRAGLIEAGFFIGATNPVGKKTSGTIACKNIELIDIPLTQKEKGLLETNAGIPYYDESLCDDTDSIIKRRELMQKSSGRMSSSKYLK